jgi:hypothetical protein
MAKFAQPGEPGRSEFCKPEFLPDLKRGLALPVCCTLTIIYVQPVYYIPFTGPCGRYR